ncbi:CDP-glycerol glycerophosphotransferase family protein [Flavobacterium sp. Fl-77]|uniref:CDP-glycerol glycerophosphotransferase family protein n=1 Tax=Flavobacterium flavipigmentatum TaxID=2893884 RepID=A0AAJ2S6Z4_9FLAO|nr:MULTISPECIES: CDP-glycerol glycerophosphotransferase family protein [unclassified Flavobacterium]MDX6181905.1 CDP-glycerol glycerophosphotransferase family protein [Flavobacterium sp. Fl-33]MDX6185061.1 CDP-glycerol glycerophosphotransferase family protein [Flavobacterium sp. Fl-77]UFH37171.1 CDP-glycerol glycerophosphotransferase family protein [Flavobacterium sp. F-70]
MTALKLIIKRYVPENLWISLIKIYNFLKIRDIYTSYLIRKAPQRHLKAIKKIKKKEIVKVAFFLNHESVWKYDVLFDLMLQHPKFEPMLFACPVVDYGMENMLFEMNKTYNSFKKKGFDIIKTYDNITGEYLDIKKTHCPDIVFFTNPYEGLQDYRYYIKHFSRTLTCYVPYAIMTTNYDAFYDLNFHNLVWRIFSETPIHQKIAFEKQRNRGKNNVVTGYPGFDKLLSTKMSDNLVWKNKNATLKKVIWAPHHSMKELNKVSNFLEYFDFFIELATTYKDKLQIAFKPHPLLRIKLENDPIWGKEKTDNYYNKWLNLENGQFENADYTALFLTSDALIHDCGSFMAEYLITGKPSLFMIRNESVMKEWSEFGEKAVAVHYQSRTKRQLTDFIENVVLNENDWMREIRQDFIQNNLVQKNNVTASQNIMHYLEAQIFE